MKKKIISILLIIAICLPNFSFATITFELSKTGESAGIESVATKIDSNSTIYVDEEFNTKSVAVPNTSIEIFNGQNEKLISAENTEDTPIAFDGTKYYLRYVDSSIGGGTNDSLYATILLGAGEVEISSVASILYKGAVKYNGNTYNARIDITNIKKTGTDQVEFQLARLGSKPHSDTGKYDVSTYTETNNPSLSIGRVVKTTGEKENTGDYNIEATIQYSVEDNDGNKIQISGIYRIDDIDVQQGTFIDNYTASADNTYIKSDHSGKLKYKQHENGSYIFTTEDDATTTDDVYIKIKDQNKIDMIYTWEKIGAFSSMVFDNSIVVNYKKITTSVTGGTITEDQTNIKDGESKTITYAPNDSEKQYLKSITVDGEEVSVTDNPENYSFTNITDNHNISVVYENKYKVIHDPMGGTPTIDNQYVMPNEKAHTVTEPTKEGYDFGGWIKQGETTPYDYDTPVTSDITLEAKWNPKEYNITYIPNGGTNNPSNPATYKTGDTKDFLNPTREGYTFLGWYEDENFTNEKPGIDATDIGDKTVYAKWEPKGDTEYKVEHYKETSDGNYELATTEELTGETDSTVTATPKEFTGYKENTTHSSRISSGTVTADGSLVLKLYYDKEEYKVTFDPQGGNPDPDDQTVEYNDKATKPNNPTKDGYTFDYWYYINDNNEKVRYNFDDPVTKDIELIAEWEKNPENKKDDKNDNNDSTTTIPTKTYTDTTTSSKILPNTGIATNIALICLAVIVIASGIKYFKLKAIIK